jgi:hypothetical protein
MSKITATSRKHGRSKKKLIIIGLVVFLVVIVLPTTALAYVGFIPGVTELMHTNKPVDLGVTYTAADFNSLSDNNAFGIGVENYDKSAGTPQNITNVASGSKLVIYGGRTNQATLTQQQLTAFVDMMPWTNSPLSNSQIRLSNGIFEFSGNVKSRYVSNLIKAVYPSGNYGQLSPLIKLASHLQNPAVYTKMSVSVDNTANGPAHGRLQLKVLALKVNRIDLSKDVSNMKAIDINVGESSWARGIGFSLGSLMVSNGQVDVYGTVPTNFAVGEGNPGAICNNYHGGSLLSLSPVSGIIGSVLKYCE